VAARSSLATRMRYRRVDMSPSELLLGVPLVVWGAFVQLECASLVAAFGRADGCCIHTLATPQM
jgi:hypothetical protein